MSWNCRNGQVPDPRPMGTWVKCPCACHRLGSERIAADCPCQRTTTPENVECPTCRLWDLTWKRRQTHDRPKYPCPRCTPENVEGPRRYGEVENPCSQCHGAGWTDAGGWNPQPCSRCNQTGHEPGNVECQTCGGRRKVQGMYHRPGDLLFDCPTCRTPENVEWPTSRRIPDRVMTAALDATPESVEEPT